jgi:sec-independent protein translocase protein TatA
MLMIVSALQLPFGNEWIVLIILAIILLFGAKKLPELARSIGRASGEFRRGKEEIERELRGLSDTSKGPIQPETQHERLTKIAKELNVPTEGKTAEQLKQDIQKALEKPS